MASATRRKRRTRPRAKKQKKKRRKLRRPARRVSRRVHKRKPSRRPSKRRKLRKKRRKTKTRGRARQPKRKSAKRVRRKNPRRKMKKRQRKTKRRTVRKKRRKTKRARRTKRKPVKRVRRKTKKRRRPTKPSRRAKRVRRKRKKRARKSRRRKTKTRRTRKKLKRRTAVRRRKLRRRIRKAKPRRALKKRKLRSSARRRWIKWPKEKLLDLRICDLGLRVERTQLASSVRQLYDELRRRGFRHFRPHVWLSDEWYSPDGVPGIAIPFYLAHPRLRQLEREMMLDLEGGNRENCMRLLRHESGHALLNAYQIHRRRDWQQHFGKSSVPYPDSYLPHPYSKRFVMHLENWYAQSHPHEDWAETFAVWLKPNSDWRKRYRGWPALKKLEYVDALMNEIKQRRPKLRNHREVIPLRSMRMTLREYYQDKQQRYGEDSPEFVDRDLRKLFSDAKEFKKNEKASRYIRRRRDEIIEIVSRWTSEYNYRINEVLSEMIERCDELELRVTRTEEEMKPEMVGCLTMLVMNKLHSGGFHISL